jgi:hypothetical protein
MATQDHTREEIAEVKKESEKKKSKQATKRKFGAIDHSNITEIKNRICFMEHQQKDNRQIPD